MMQMLVVEYIFTIYHLQFQVNEMKGELKEFQEMFQAQRREKLEAKGNYDSEVTTKLSEKNEQISDLIEQITVSSSAFSKFSREIKPCAIAFSNLSNLTKSLKKKIMASRTKWNEPKMIW